MRENATSSDGANQTGKRISAETPSTHGPDGLVRMALACGGREAGGAGWTKGQVVR
jgi:hypothetical protein